VNYRLALAKLAQGCTPRCYITPLQG